MLGRLAWSGIGVVLLLTFSGCGTTRSQGGGWGRHVVLRPCDKDYDRQDAGAVGLCPAYRPLKELTGAITDVHYVFIQAERIFLRDLPEWVRGADAVLVATIDGLLPSGNRYRQVVDVVHIDDDGTWEGRNYNMNLPVRYRNRPLSVRLSLVGLDNAGTGRRWFRRGIALRHECLESPLGEGPLGTALTFRIVEDTAAAILDQGASKKPELSLAHLDFVPAADISVVGSQGLRLTHAVYAVVPAGESARVGIVPGGASVEIDRAWLEANVTYRHGSLALKDSLSDYRFTGYVVLRTTSTSRWPDRKPAWDSMRRASRYMDVGNLDAAKRYLSLAAATMSPEVESWFTRRVAECSAGSFEDGRIGLLELTLDEIVDCVWQSAAAGGDAANAAPAELRRIRAEALRRLRPPGGVDDSVKDDPFVAAELPSPTFDPEAGMYTVRESMLLMDLYTALAARYDLLRQTASPGPDQFATVLEFYLQVKLRDPHLPLFNSECELLTRSTSALWLDTKTGYGIPSDVEVGSGVDLPRFLDEGNLGGKKREEVVELLQRLRADVNWLNDNCLETGPAR